MYSYHYPIEANYLANKEEVMDLFDSLDVNIYYKRGNKRRNVKKEKRREKRGFGDEM
jgi:hypothetical protein